MNEFEKACNTENYTGETSQENVIEWSDEQKLELAERLKVARENMCN